MAEWERWHGSGESTRSYDAHVVAAVAAVTVTARTPSEQAAPGPQCSAGQRARADVRPSVEPQDAMLRRFRPAGRARRAHISCPYEVGRATVYQAVSAEASAALGATLGPTSAFASTRS